MKFCVAGNHALDPSVVAMHLVRQLAELPIDATVMLRAPLQGKPGPIEQVCESLCKTLSIPVEWRVPKPNTGGEGTIDRDYAMVEASAGVIAYFHPDHAMSDDRGTTRLVRHALSADIPVQAFTASDEAIAWLGSNEEVTTSA